MIEPSARISGRARPTALTSQVSALEEFGARSPPVGPVRRAAHVHCATHDSSVPAILHAAGRPARPPTADTRALCVHPPWLDAMRPCRGATPHHDRSGWRAGLVPADDGRTRACGTEMRALGSIILSCGDAHQVRPAARWRRPRGFARPSPSGWRPTAGHHRAQGGAGLPPGRLGQRHRRHRAPHLAGPSPRRSCSSPARASCRSSTHRAQRASRKHRHGGRLAQSRYDKEGPGGRRGLHQLPHGPRAVRRLHRRAARRAEVGVQGLGACPYFDGCLPIEGDGRARPRDPAPRADEAGGPDQRA